MRSRQALREGKPRGMLSLAWHSSAGYERPPFLVAILPDFKFALDSRYTPVFVIDSLREWGRQLHFEVCDLLPAVSGQRSNEVAISGGDGHPNAKGHTAIAKALYPAIARGLEKARKFNPR